MKHIHGAASDACCCVGTPCKKNIGQPSCSVGFWCHSPVKGRTTSPPLRRPSDGVTGLLVHPSKVVAGSGWLLGPHDGVWVSLHRHITQRLTVRLPRLVRRFAQPRFCRQGVRPVGCRQQPIPHLAHVFPHYINGHFGRVLQHWMAIGPCCNQLAIRLPQHQGHVPLFGNLHHIGGHGAVHIRMVEPVG